jgi:hypothetical protein
MDSVTAMQIMFLPNKKPTRFGEVGRLAWFQFSQA